MIKFHYQLLLATLYFGPIYTIEACIVVWGSIIDTTWPMTLISLVLGVGFGLIQMRVNKGGNLGTKTILFIPFCCIIAGLAEFVLSITT